ncbi:unnamed protein product [Lactuca virosa]|uniref:F-box domain-containing protein n=1 Tax=Lactuca virosa TaxID=75947 RepID=A0AAU9P3C9_9ASTR|nr:unnamed protein product [Lactuca virosa]
MPPSTTTKTKKIMSFLDSCMEDLPVHVMDNILSRLPIKTIIRCKCVCKKWLDHISDSYFANIQLSRSPTGLMIHSENNKFGHPSPGLLNWIEVEDKFDHHHLHHDPVMNLDLNLTSIFQKSQIKLVGSVNGLLCLWQYAPESDNTYICNPITREYMILPRQQYYRESIAIIVYCFGVGSLTREYKVIRIFQGNIPHDPTSKSRPSLVEAEVYTLGTGEWRSLGHAPYLLKGFHGPFLNGHAHWIVVDEDSPEKLCAFDFDNETFELFPSPPSEARDKSWIYKSVGVLKGCLCQCDTYDSKFTVWVMKEYGIKKSWYKELVMQQSINPNHDLLTMETMYIIKGLKDGTILMASCRSNLHAYCPRRKIVIDTERFDYNMEGYTYRPSFHRLHNFKHERVHKF